MTAIALRTRWLIRAFVVLVVAVNLPQVPELIHRLAGGADGYKPVAGMIAVVFLALAVMIWVSAIQHLRLSRLTLGPNYQRWYVIVFGLFVFGAMFYYWKVMRPQLRTAELSQAGPIHRV
jgi:hypothetical protein